MLQEVSELSRLIKPHFSLKSNKPLQFAATELTITGEARVKKLVPSVNSRNQEVDDASERNQRAASKSPP